jgi:hypothetical protein
MVLIDLVSSPLSLVRSEFVSLQRSEMFIDNPLNPINRAPAERNVPTLAGGLNDVSLRWSEQNLLTAVRSITSRPNGAKGNNILLHF